MGEVDRILSEPLLEERSLEEEFERNRGRVSQRHRSWRANFPAIGLLLDSEEERARALAGNYATEARETVGVWLSALETLSEDPVDRHRRAEWIAAFNAAWRRQVVAADDVAALEGVERRAFWRLFDELAGRFENEAVEYLETIGERRNRRPSLTARLLRPLSAVKRAMKGFFLPTVAR